jgi:SNF2 family DNA or RNA helicase
MRRLGPSFYRATKATSLDLPPSPPARRILLDFSPETKELYKYVKEYGEAGLGDGSSLMGTRSTLIRLQQITGGFVFNPDGTYTEEDAGQPHDLRMRFINSPKMEWLTEYVNDTLAGDASIRCIVWCKFNTEVLHITAKLNKILDGRVAMAIGAVKTSEMEEIKASFNSRDPNGIQVIVANYPKLCAGHNLQSGDIHIRYSHTWSFVQSSQARARSERLGRNAPVQQIELAVRGTVDVDILRSLDNLGDLQVRLAPDTTSYMP